MIHPHPKPLTSYETHENTGLAQIAVMAYEFGDLAKMLVYGDRYDWIDPQKSKGYKLEAKIAMSDLILQCVLMCERQGWNFWELKKLGEERFREKVDRHRELGE